MITHSNSQTSSPRRSRGNSQTTVSRILSESDQFRQRPELRVMQQDSYSTVFGQFMTIIMIVICLATFATSLYSVTNHLTPSISQTQEVLVETSAYPLYRNNFTLVINIRDVYGNPFADLHQYLQFQVQNCLLNQTTKADGSILTIPTCANYSMQQCDMETSFKSVIQKEYFSKKNLTGLYCINSTEWDKNPIGLQGTQQAAVYQLLQVLTRACQNSSSFSGCQSQENINAYLTSITYVFIIDGTLSQVANYEEPFQNYIASKYTILSIGASKTVYQNLVINEVKTDTGIVFDDTSVQQMLGFSDIETDSNPYNGLALCNHMIAISGIKHNYSRTYQKLQTILGQVGGLWQVAYFVFGLFIHRIAKKMLYLHMAHDLFDLNTQINNTPPKDVSDLEAQSIRKILKKQTQIMKIDKISLCKFICGIEAPLQYEIAHQRIEDQVDLQYILGKLNEIDQLKEIILTTEQNQLFDFIVKPSLEIKEHKTYRELIETTRNAYLKVKEESQQTDQKLLLKLDPILIHAFQNQHFLTSPQNEQTPLNSGLPNITDPIFNEGIDLEAIAQKPRFRNLSP